MKDKSEWSEFELALLASWGKSSWGRLHVRKSSFPHFPITENVLRKNIEITFNV
jgi:hypothetical protein